MHLALALTLVTAPPALRCEGNRLLTDDGQPVRLRGVSIASLEWSNEGEHVAESIPVAMDQWGANCIRLPLAQDRWFGHAQGQTDAGERYRAIVREAIEAVSQRNGWIVLDLHWSNAGAWGRNIGQHKMPDQLSAVFWRTVAAEYADHPAVLFDLYNEPHGVSWEVWRDGGLVTEEKDGWIISYASPGLQGLVDTVRAAGARNPVVIGGLDWGYSLKGVVEGFALSDPLGDGILYGSHIYPWKGAQPANWEPHVTVVAEEYPIFVGEVGCEPDEKHEDPTVWGPRILAWMEEYGIHWTAWCFHPGASPRMLQNWDYEPTDYWGRFVRDALQAAR